MDAVLGVGGRFPQHSSCGDVLSPAALTQQVHQYLVRGGFKGRGSCHLFQHAYATAMLEDGAGVRFVQELLGHSSLKTTQMYTHVTITKLKAVHEVCHPGAKPVAEARPASVGDGNEGHDDGENGRDELQE